MDNEPAFTGGHLLVPITLFGWIPVVLFIFWLLPPRRAIVVAFLTAWLLLPVASFHIAGIPSYDKVAATCGGVLLAALIFDIDRMKSLSFFPSWVDLAMIVWCLCPMATAISNDPEVNTHDGMSWVLQNIITWGLPYLIGRIYFADLTAMRELTIGVFIGGLVYIPLCLFEIRFSPQLHRLVYGYYQNDFGQTFRFGGFRPTVFLQHGLAVGLYMCAASLCGFWLWKTGAVKRIGRIPILALLVPLIIVSILCKSAGAIIFLFAGTVALMVYRWLGGISILVLLLAPTVYVGLRTLGNWNGEGVPEIVSAFGPDRTQSLMFRFQNEQGITEHGMQRPWLGWGGYGRPFLHDSKGKIKYTPDSLWIIAFGSNGIVGEVSLLMMAVPVIVLLFRLPYAARVHPAFAGVTLFCLLFAIFQLDNMMNDFIDPIFILGLGGLCGLAQSKYLVPTLQRRPVMTTSTPAATLAPLLAIPTMQGPRPN